MEFKDKINQSVAAAVAKIMGEALHPNQQKLDVHEPEKDKLTADDFKKLRSGKKPEMKKEEVKDEYARKVDKYLKKKHAPDAPVKEEVEQIDELSTKTLASAAKSASDPDSDYHYGKSHDPQKFADHAKKTKDAKSAAAVQGAADAKGHYARPGHTLGSYDKLAHRTPARVTSAGKANKQDVNRLKGNIQRNEDVEQLDEVKMADLPSTKVQGRSYGSSKPQPSAFDVLKGPKEKELKSIESEKKKKSVNEEDAYDKNVKPSDKPHDKDAAKKRAQTSAVAARKVMSMSAYSASKKSE
jgi:hypothetical protein